MHSGFVVAISVLATVFIGSLLILIVVIRKKLCRTTELFLNFSRSNIVTDQSLIENIEVPQEIVSGVELGEVAAQNEESFDGSCPVTSNINLVPHCLGILKATHLLTDYVVKHTLIESRKVYLQEALPDLIPLANKIGVRVDEVVRSMYPPFDPRLLEARCSALVFTVKNLLFLVESVLLGSCPTDWMNLIMLNIEEHLKILREASITYEKLFTSVAMAGLENGEEENKLIDIESEPCRESSSSV